MKNLIQKSNANNLDFSHFSKFQLHQTQLRNIKGGSDSGGTGEGENGIVVEDELIG